MKYSQADIDKARRDFVYTLKPWVEGSSQDTITEGSDWYSAIIGLPPEIFNMVWIASLGKDSMEAALADLEHRTLAGYVRLSGAGLMHAKRLQERGYTIGGGNALMAWHPDKNSEAFKLRAGLEVRRITNDIELVTMLEIFQSSFEIDDATMKYFNEFYGNWDLDHFLWALFDGAVMVSIVTSTVFENNVGIYSMATPASAQKKGYGAELLQYVQQFHAKAGQDTGLLFASAAGKFLYDKLGWDTLEYTQYYSRKPV